ncbi:MAG: ThuA domain-containing protein [Gemmataceae bacterium]
MNRREWLSQVASGWGMLVASSWPMGWVIGQEARRKRILFFTRSQGFEHSVIRRPSPNVLSHAERIVVDLGKKHGFDVVASKDGRIFIPEELHKFDAFFFYTTGDLTREGGDNNPPMPPEGKQALLRAIEQGKGFIGSHCASDTFHSPGDRRRHQSREQQDPYIAMLGGEFITHGIQQKATMRVTSPRFPGLKDVQDFQLFEEWYALKNFAPDLHVILAQDSKGMKGAEYQRPLFPATWARRHGQGRVFYTSMGHREDVWTHPLFQQILLGGIAWALRNVDADVSPNMDKVTPDAMKLPA